MKKVFYDVNEAIDFARSVGAVNIDRFCSYDVPSIGGVITNLGKTIGFDIEGFSDVKPLIYVYHSNEESCYNEIRLRAYLLEVEGYGKFVLSNMDKGKWGLSSLLFLNTSYTTFSYFKSGLIAPQNIGKATKTKIINWCEYVRQLEDEKLRYFNQRKERREKTIAAIRKSCPVLRVREGNKVYNEYEFQPIEMTYISPDGLKICWQFGNDGSIGRSYGYDFTKADALANSLDGNLR